MPELAMSRTIAAPVDATFAAFSDFANAPQRVSAIKRVELVTPGAVRVGTRFRETRVMFGKEATEVFEVVGFEPGRSYALRCQACGAEWRYDFAFRPEGRGTRVDVKASVRGVSFFAKLMAPLAGLMMKSISKAFEKDLDDLERSLTGARAGAAGAT